MNAKLLIIIGFFFFMAWRRGGDALLLFCALCAAGLSICVMIFNMETSYLKTAHPEK